MHCPSASPATAWPGPPDGWEYTSSYDACNAAAAPGSPSMVDFYREIAPKLRKTVVFNGDTDPCVSYEGTRDAIYSVGFPEVDGGSSSRVNGSVATLRSFRAASSASSALPLLPTPRPFLEPSLPAEAFVGVCV